MKQVSSTLGKAVATVPPHGLVGFQDLVAPGADRVFTFDPGSR